MFQRNIFRRDFEPHTRIFPTCHRPEDHNNRSLFARCRRRLSRLDALVEVLGVRHDASHNDDDVVGAALSALLGKANSNSSTK